MPVRSLARLHDERVAAGIRYVLRRLTPTGCGAASSVKAERADHVEFGHDRGLLFLADHHVVLE